MTFESKREFISPSRETNETSLTPLVEARKAGGSEARVKRDTAEYTVRGTEKQKRGKMSRGRGRFRPGKKEIAQDNYLERRGT